jgi:hypothetical protein
MKIYEINSREGYQFCHPKDKDDFERINLLINGTERRQSWSPVNMRILKEDMGKHLRESDSPWLGSHSLIFGEQAVSVLHPLLAANGELLALACAEAKLSIYNPTKVLDGLDESASATTRFSSGRIISITRHVFKPEVVREAELFKLSCLRVSPTFVQQEFVDLWNASQLRGLDFMQVWEGG